MIGTCPHDCNNKTVYGYCKTTACIHPTHGKGEYPKTTVHYEPITYKMVQCVEISDESIERIVDAVVKALKEGRT